LVAIAIIAAAPVAALAVAGMIALGLREGDGLASNIAGNLQAIALAIVVSVGSVVSHYLGVVSGGNQPAIPPATTGASNTGGGA
jgi:hypothetical protein